MMNNFSPLRYPGGKNKTYLYVQYLVNHNNIKTYIEPYCGGAAVAIKLLLNNDVERIMLNDFDRSIYALWYSILYNTEDLIEKVKNTIFTLEEWKYQKEIQNNKESMDLLSLGYSTLYLNRTNRSGIIQAGLIGGKKQNGNYKMDCRFNIESLIEKIKLISNKKNSIKIYNLDALDFIKYNISRTKNSLTFFDPPYYIKGKQLYINYYEKQDHLDLKNTIANNMSTKKWILTYDVHEDIKSMYCDYEHFLYQLNYSAGRVKKSEEYIFLSDNISSVNIEKYLLIQ